MAEQNTAARVLELARGEIGATSGEKYLRYFNQVNTEGIVLPFNAAWCAAWVTWVMRHAGVPVDSVPNYKGCATASDWFQRRGRFRSRKSGYVPKPGDIIMYEWDPQNEGTAYDDGDDHTGIVERVENGRVYTIEGNNGGQCRRDWWGLTNACISGYCVPLYNIDKEEENDMTEQQAFDIAMKAIRTYETGKANKAASEWAKVALAYGKENKIMVGDAESGNLRPQDDITRQEVMQMLYNVLCKYKTIDDVPGWGKETVQQLIDLGVVKGTGTDEQDRVLLEMSQAELRMLCWLVRYVDTIFQTSIASE